MNDSDDRLRRCEQVREIWDSIKIRLAMQRRELEGMYVELIMNQGGEDWR